MSDVVIGDRGSGAPAEGSFNIICSFMSSMKDPMMHIFTFSYLNVTTVVCSITVNLQHHGMLYKYKYKYIIRFLSEYK